MANVDDWVHRFHTGTVSGTVAGIVDVDPGRSRPIRMLRWLMRLPPPAVRQTARLCIVRRAEGASAHERWSGVPARAEARAHTARRAQLYLRCRIRHVAVVRLAGA